jgi:hypothetical protein
MNQMVHPAFLWPDADSDLLSRRAIVTIGARNIPYQQLESVEPADIPHVSGLVHDIARLLKHGGVPDEGIRNILKTVVRIIKAVPGDETFCSMKDNFDAAGLLMFPRLLRDALGTRDWKSPLLEAVSKFSQEELHLPHSVHVALFRHLKEAIHRTQNPTAGIAQIAMATALIINDAKSRHKFKDDQPIVNDKIKTVVKANAGTVGPIIRSIMSCIKVMGLPVRLPTQRINIAASTPRLNK